MPTVNSTNYFENVTSLKGIFNIPNLTTGGFAWIGLLIMMQVIIFLGFLQWGAVTAVISSAFISLIAGLFLTYLGYVSWVHLMIFLAQILFAFIYLTWQEKSA